MRTAGCDQTPATSQWILWISQKNQEADHTVSDLWQGTCPGWWGSHAVRGGSRECQRSLATKNLHSGHMDTTHVDSDLHATNTKLQPAWVQEGSVERVGSQPQLPWDSWGGFTKIPMPRPHPLTTSVWSELLVLRHRHQNFIKFHHDDSSQVWETLVKWKVQGYRDRIT